MRSEMKTSSNPPSPPPNDKPQPKGKEKRPWSKPKIRIIEVAFDTLSGDGTNPEHYQEGNDVVGGTGATYRVS